jgi:hypothetical protein
MMSVGVVSGCCCSTHSPLSCDVPDGPEIPIGRIDRRPSLVVTRPFLDGPIRLPSSLCFPAFESLDQFGQIRRLLGALDEPMFEQLFGRRALNRVALQT